MSKMSELHAEVQQASQLVQLERGVGEAQPLIDAIRAMYLPVEMFVNNRGGGFLMDDELARVMDYYIATAGPTRMTSALGGA